MTLHSFSRRSIISAGAAAVIAPPIRAQTSSEITRKLILKSGATIPVIGMGTWLTFNIGLKSPGMAERRKVLETFFQAGGGMIDSSPMYGKAEAVIGHLMPGIKAPERLYSATKIWTPLAGHGRDQLQNSHDLWEEPMLDLVYVHNLLSWRAHLKTLRAAKAAGRVRAIGLTTSHGRRHDTLEDLIGSENIDAIQVSYNILDRAVENRILPAARDRGLAVIINRPFRTGQLFSNVKNKPLPEFAIKELSCQSWAEYLLKYVVSHPAVHCAIPATRRVDHIAENMRAASGAMPDMTMRRKMREYFEAL